jgi:3-oxoacyl-[acyl-carrier protein] reductase
VGFSDMENNMNAFSLSGWTAQVTEGSRGIGAAIVDLFAAQGAKVGSCQFGDDANAEATQARMAARGTPVVHCVCDVVGTQTSSVSRSGRRGRWGPSTFLSIARGSAAKRHSKDFGGRLRPHDRGASAWHVYGHAAVLRRPGDALRKDHQFLFALAYKGGLNMTHYCAAKAGIVVFNRALAHEAAPNSVTVYSIAPGPM